jgi:hypothetical protein
MPPRSRSSQTPKGDVSCKFCGCFFKSQGLKSHERACKFKPGETAATDAEFEAQLQEDLGESGISSSKINYKFSCQPFL